MLNLRFMESLPILVVYILGKFLVAIDLFPKRGIISQMPHLF